MALTALLVVTLAVALAAPVFAQGRPDSPGNSGGGGGNPGGGNSGNDNRGNSGNNQTATATATRTTTSGTTTTTTAPTGTTASDTDDGGKGKGKDRDKDEDYDNHGAAVRDPSSGAGSVSDAARSALGKPDQAVVSVTGPLASVTEAAAVITAFYGDVTVNITDATRIKAAGDSDASVADLQALAGGDTTVRARGRLAADGSLNALRIEVRKAHAAGEAGDGEMEEADGAVDLEGIIDTVTAASSSFTLVTRAGTAPTGTTATTPTAPTGTTATTTTAPTGTTATTTAGVTYTVMVGPATTIKRNDVTAPLSALRSGDEVEARGTLAGTTLTATRVLADGPAAGGTTTTTTAPTGSTATTTR